MIIYRYPSGEAIHLERCGEYLMAFIEANRQSPKHRFKNGQWEYYDWGKWSRDTSNVLEALVIPISLWLKKNHLTLKKYVDTNPQLGYK